MKYGINATVEIAYHYDDDKTLTEYPGELIGNPDFISVVEKEISISVYLEVEAEDLEDAKQIAQDELEDELNWSIEDANITSASISSISYDELGE